MVLGDPEQGVGEEVVPDLGTAVVEDERSPVGVPALARVGVVVEVGAVEEGEAVGVLREVGGDPVDEHAYPRPVEGVDETLEVVRRAEPARRGEETQRLVAPRAVEGVLGGRQELDVGVAHLCDVGDELLGELAVSVVGAVGVPLPGAQMHLVGRHRGVEGGPGFASFHPGGVVPLVARGVVDDGGRAWKLLGAEAEGVGLQRQEFAVRAEDLVLVHLALRRRRG